MASGSYSKFNEVTTFLAEHRWIYDFKLTRFFQHSVWKDIPVEWKDTLMDLSGEELAGLPFGKTQAEWPESLNNFIQSCVKYTLPREQTLADRSNCNKCSDRVTSPDYLFHKDDASGSANPLKQKHESPEYNLYLDKLSDQIIPPEINCQDLCQGQVTLKECSEELDEGEITEIKPNINRIVPLDTREVDPDIRKGMSEKKLHEVCHMTALIDHVTKIAGNNATVDVGSGLGYLGQVLHCNYDHSVLGLEGKQGHTTGADRRLNKNENCRLLHNVTCELHQDSQSEFLFLIQDWFSMRKEDGNRCCHQTVSSKTENHRTGTKTLLEEDRYCHQTASSKTEILETDSMEAKCDKTGSCTFLACANKCCHQTLSSKVEDHATGSIMKEMNPTCAEDMDNTAVALQDDYKYRSCHIHTPCTVSPEMKKDIIDSVNDQKIVKSDKKAVQNDQKVMGNDQKAVKIDRKAVKNDQKAMKSTGNNQKVVKSDQKDVDNYQKAMKTDQKTMKNDQKSVVIVKNECNGSGEDVPRLCMVGLHCCGDLTPTMLRYFVELDCITSLCCVSCCYHRMQFNDHLNQHENFPMSRGLKGSLGTVKSAYPDFSFSSYCLRLAAQETRARWHKQTQKDHDFHVKNVAYRGILEACLEQGDKTFQLKKCVRKLAHKTDYDSFTKYIDAVFKHIDIPDMATQEERRHAFEKEMEQKYAAYKQYFCFIEPITALQFLLQPVIESLIYLDRKCWLEEHGFHVHIVPIFDEFISPRNLALVANKLVT